MRARGVRAAAAPVPTEPRPEAGPRLGVAIGPPAVVAQLAAAAAVLVRRAPGVGR